jgi:hypothetical protein
MTCTNCTSDKKCSCSCEHTKLAYCKTCGCVYCLECGKKWYKEVNYPIYRYPEPSITYDCTTDAPYPYYPITFSYTTKET